MSDVPEYDLSTCNVLIATPCYGNMMCNSYFTSIIELIAVFSKFNIKFSIHTIGNESLIPRGRNYYVSLMLSNPHFTHLLFIDSDIQFNADNVIRMLRFNKSITGGAYPKKSVNWTHIIDLVKNNPDITPIELETKSYDYVINVITRTEQLNKDIQIVNGFIPVSYLGTGFMLIQRDVLVRMAKSHQELKYRNDIEGYAHGNNNDKFFALFDCIIDHTSNRYLSEDYAFCQRALEMGIDIWCDILCNLTHTGSNHFRGAFISTIAGNIRHGTSGNTQTGNTETGTQHVHNESPQNTIDQSQPFPLVQQ